MLVYHKTCTMTEAYNLPIGLRHWFIQRTLEQLEKEKEAMDKAGSGTSGNSKSNITPEMLEKLASMKPKENM